MINIDGSKGEGGGQVLRSSLALSMVTGQPFKIKNIRAKRNKPGLLRQHLTAVRAATDMCDANVSGAELQSQELTFTPGETMPGEYHFAVGSAGSATLVMQTILPAIAMKKGEYKITFEGGTHNHAAPPFEFIKYSFAPILKRMGMDLKLNLQRCGFYPAGGGRFTLEVSSIGELNSIDLLERGELRHKQAIAIVSKLPILIAEREIEAVGAHELWQDAELKTKEDKTSPGTGNILILKMAFDHVTETMCEFGEKGIKSEEVARRALLTTEFYNQSSVAVGRYLADQLLLPMALSGSGAFTTPKPTLHTLTNIKVVKQFLPVEISISEDFNRRFLLKIQ